MPSHVNGICGLKPTPGRLSLRGSLGHDVLPGNEAIPDAAGPLARNVADLDLAMRVLSAPGLERIDPRVAPVPWRDPASVSIAGLRVGCYEDDGFVAASPAIARAVREAAGVLRDRGATVEPFQPPRVDEGLTLFYQLSTAGGGEGMKRTLGKSAADPRVKDLITLAGMPGPLRPLVAQLLRAGGQKRLSGLLPKAGRRSSSAYLALVDARRRYREEFAAAMDAGGFDALICPPNALPAFTHGAARDLGAWSINYTALYNLLAWPAGVAAVTRVREDEQGGRPDSKDKVDRAARTVDANSAGLPAGVRVAARPWREDLVLAAMAALEAGFRMRLDYPAHPPL